MSFAPASSSTTRQRVADTARRAASFAWTQRGTTPRHAGCLYSCSVTAPERTSVEPPPPSFFPPPEVEDSAHRLVGVRVLVVEDEPDTRELVAAILERLGAQVLAFPNAEEALGAFDAFEPHVLVSDLALPRVDGWELIRRVRARTRGRTIPAMALSANASLEDAGRALDAGFDVHLAKPISREELIAAVSSIVDIRRF